MQEVFKIPIPIGYQEDIVTPRSSGNLEAYWSFSAVNTGSTLILPDGRCDIIVCYNRHDTNQPVPVITGPATQPYRVEYTAGDCWLGVRFRPDNGCVIWQQRMANAVDTVLRGEDALALLPKLAQLMDTDLTPHRLAQLLELKSPPLSDGRLSKTLDAIHTSGGRIRINNLAMLAGCTSRQLNRLFRCNTGLTTKTYAQLVQFHRTLKLMMQEKLSMSDAAYEGGYSDHAHMTRSFQRFGGFTPSGIPHDLSLPALQL